MPASPSYSREHIIPLAHKHNRRPPFPGNTIAGQRPRRPSSSADVPGEDWCGGGVVADEIAVGGGDGSAHAAAAVIETLVDTVVQR